jgi:folate-binding protein YgfZ
MSDFWNPIIANTPITATVDDNETAACTMAPIVNRTVLSISGPDSAKFMQGQFTCNIQEINGSQFSHGACCNAKGRMVANFTLSKHNDDYLMAIDESLADVLTAHLKKYKVFFKTDIQITDYVMVGVKGPSASTVLTQVLGGCPTGDFGQYSFDQGLITQLPFGAGYECWLSAETAQASIDTLLEYSHFADSQYWPLNFISHGLVQLTQKNSETYIPQMINLGEVGGISFNKGCYTGQEIVARMQYLGKVKRNTYLVAIKSESPMAGELFTADSKSTIGVIISSHTSAGTIKALAVIENKYVDTPLFLGTNQGIPVELLSLPYNPQNDPQNPDS